MKKTKEHILFHGGILSNWALRKTLISYNDTHSGETLKFHNSEQLFMYLKAIHFGDHETAEAIIGTPDPKEAKALGRTVRNFDFEEWKSAREDCMMTALRCKAESWEEFRMTLLSSGNLKFVEASPYDRIWGIGLGEDNPDADIESRWRGLNLLGKCLDRTREQLRKENPY